MLEDADAVRRRAPEARIDAVDRRLLGLLAQDATPTYAELGRRLNLPAAAVHERTRRLKASGVVRGTVALLDPDLVGRPLLAFVHVDTEGWGKSPAVMRLAGLPDVEELHSVAGDASLILKVRCASPGAPEDVLARIYAVPGVRTTRSYVALRSVLERGPSAEAGGGAAGPLAGDEGRS